MQKDRIVGIDIGSRSIEMALLEEGRLVDQARLPTTFDPLKPVCQNSERDKDRKDCSHRVRSQAFCRIL